MTEKELTTRVLLSTQRALLGAISPNIRLITVGWDNLNLFCIRAYYDSVPTEEDIDEMNAVCAEIDSDIPFEKDRVECIYDTRLKKDLEILEFIVYSRKESI